MTINRFARAATVVFDQAIKSEDGEVEGTHEVLVPISADGESVMFSLPNGAEWGCNQRELAKLVDGKYTA